MTEVKITRAELEKCLERNFTISEIAKMYRCNRKTVYEKVKKLKKEKELNIVKDEYVDSTPRYFNVEVDDMMIINGMKQMVTHINEDFFTTIRANAVRESYLIKDFIFNLSSFLINKKQTDSECGNCMHNKYGRCDLHKKHFYELYKGPLCNKKQPVEEDDIYGEDTFISYM
jgi:hypothetical protein